MPDEEKISLREYFESKITDIKDSVKLAYSQMEKRLEGMNEFRDTLKDQASRFVTRDEMESKMSVMQSKIDALNKVVWMATGGLVVFQIVIKFFVK